VESGERHCVPYAVRLTPHLRARILLHPTSHTPSTLRVEADILLIYSSTRATAPRGTRTGTFGLRAGLRVGVLSSWGGGGGCEEDCEDSDSNGPTPLPDRPPSFSFPYTLPPLRADTPLFPADVINVSGHRLSTASALIMHKGVADTAGALPPPPGSFDAELTWGAANDRDGGRADGAGGVYVCDAQAVRGFLVLLLP
jgi:hypothetical protein